MAFRSRRQVGVLEYPPEQSQGRKSVSFYGESNGSVNRVVKAASRSGSNGSRIGSYSNSHRGGAVKPIEVTIGSSSSSDSSQTPPIEYLYSKWSLMTTMGWIAAKSNHSPGVRARWTSHRKVRRCKGCPTGAYLVDGTELDVNYKYSTIKSEEIKSFDLENHATNSVHKVKQNHPTIEHNLRTSSDTSHAMDSRSFQPPPLPLESKIIKFKKSKYVNICQKRISKDFSIGYLSIGITLVALCLFNEFQSVVKILETLGGQNDAAYPNFFSILRAEASLIIGDSAIEIQEIDTADSNNNNNNHNNNNNDVHIINSNNNNDGAMRLQNEQPNELIFGSTGGIVGSFATQLDQQADSIHPHRNLSKRPSSFQMPGPLPPIGGGGGGKGLEDITDGDKRSRNSHDYDIHEINLDEKDALKEVFPVRAEQSAEDKAIAGKVVDFELTPAGGHNKAKIKKKKKKMKEEEMFKKWGKKKESEKKFMEKKHKESMKKKKEEGKKGKKKWGKEEHGLKKKGKFKKNKWGEKVKQGKGLKKGKKGKKFLKDVGHKDTGFKTVYHKEEWGKTSKWHDIKRQKKWDEGAKKWKKNWKKVNGKKYKGDHMKKFEKKKKFGKKYKKESKDKFKKFKKEKFEKGKKKKMEEKSKKKEGGAKMKKELKKKKKKS